jgi:branched-chain amino acid aminotransferase
MLPYIIYNGQLLPSGDAFVTADSRALRFGDGIFETIKVIDGRILFLDDHLMRLQEGMRTLSLTLPVENLPQFVADQILKLLETNKTTSARVRISIWRSGSGFYLPDKVPGLKFCLLQVSLIKKAIMSDKSVLSVGILTGPAKISGRI